MEADSRFDHGTLTALAMLLLLFSASVHALPDSPNPFLSSHPNVSGSTVALLRARLLSLCQHPLVLLNSFSSSSPVFFWSMVTAATILGAFPCVWVLRDQPRRKQSGRSSIRSGKDVSETVGLDALSSDPGLLKKHSEFRSYTTDRFTYPSIRTFYRPHPQGSKLPNKPTPLPLLVFVHGLGGSVAQFHPILVSLVNIAPCLAIDLPGCGLSEFKPTTWDAYTTDALVRLLAVAIGAHRDAESGQEVILVGHSMGCSLNALLASNTSPYSHLISTHVNGFIAICPSAKPPGPEDVKKFKIGLNIPGFLFDIWRRYDRRGGTESGSVTRFVGAGAEEETKKLQVRFNEQSKTPVFRRMARGCLPDYSSGTAKGGLPGREVWSGIKIPMFLAAGEKDHVTPPDNLKVIAGYLGKTSTSHMEKHGSSMEKHGTIPDSAAPIDIDASRKDSKILSNSPRLNASIAPSDATTLVSTSDETDFAELTKSTSRAVLKSSILPAPASHALLYAPSHSRILAGLIQSFLADHIDKRLSLGWQLQYLTTEGKWDVKNLEKWKAVAPVSFPIAGVFRAMKTLREVDEAHCPKVFVNDWAGKIHAVVDISHESPVYDPKGLEAGGIEYHKFPTVSKLPPQVDEVKSFITLIDQLRSSSDSSSAANDALIGVHCHYGFNRTGFFLVCYMVERLGYKLQDAIDEFGNCRPPGIRHGHFVDTLHVRYCVGLRRAPTL